MEYQKTSKRQISIRIIADIVLVVCIFVAPFWLTAFLAILSALFFARYYEIIFFGLLLDALYLPEFSGVSIAPMTFSAIAVYIVTVFIKPRLRAFA